MAIIETFFGPQCPDDKSELFDASSFLGFLRRSHPVWQPVNKKADYQQWVYRGHWDVRWRLVPSAARPLIPEFDTEKANKLEKVINNKRSILDNAWEGQNVTEIKKT